MPRTLQQALKRSYRSIKGTWCLIRAARYDTRQFMRFSGIADQSRASVQEAMITRTYHRIEKGLALPEPRPGFGRAVELQLAREVADFQSLFSSNRTTRIALNTAEEYVRFNEAHGIPMNDVRDRWRLLGRQQGAVEAHAEGGTKTLERRAIQGAGGIDFRAFVSSRHSVRDFADDPVPMESLENAVQMAQSAPSVCNRQSGRVYFTRDPRLKQKLLAHQNGNRGFGDRVDTLLVVTSRLDCFLTVGERYQCWIDGGLFAMTLIYALHSLGIGTCCLNWSVEPDVDRCFKADAGVPEGEAVIMLLAAGMLPDRLRVAASPRRPLAEVLREL